MAREKTSGEKPRRIALQVPKGINLSQMSDEEIERLALEMSRKVASSLPKGSTLTGVEGVSMMQTGVGVGVGWSRACGRADLSREGLVVNPEVFVDQLRLEDLAGKSARITINTKAATRAASPAAKSAGRKSKKK